MEFVTLESAQRQFEQVGSAFGARGWVPATSGNFSAWLHDSSIAITASGRHKGRLGAGDLMRVDPEGRPLDGGKPSAETGLHLQLYRLFPNIGAVLHTHSPGGVAFSRAFPHAKAWSLSGHELLKALPGVTTHETTVRIPIVENDQDIGRLASVVEPLLLANPTPAAYLIRGHGLYGWGKDIAEAERVVEALEWLFAAELTERLYRTGA